MDKEHLQAIGTIVGALGAAVLAGFAAVRQAMKPAAPPPERPPTVNETKAALETLRDRIDHGHSIAEEDRRDMSRQLDRLERLMQRADDRLERIEDRMVSDTRLGTAIARLGRPE
ncbi:hypothetical protein DRW48_10595 [Paracoccus suum]|uniref:Uncharacterized protein n=1 Tax=Paracoccus suum TaxID=2259340 RepID=A0A344PL28_9RHOB|nr:hypothetical protein [Paracoccus suum]AXC50083.1 hypothetical protein DRW48_10595 [Paracoccus suum]